MQKIIFICFFLLVGCFNLCMASAQPSPPQTMLLELEARLIGDYNLHLSRLLLDEAPSFFHAKPHKRLGFKAFFLPARIRAVEMDSIALDRLSSGYLPVMNKELQNYAAHTTSELVKQLLDEKAPSLLTKISRVIGMTASTKVNKNLANNGFVFFVCNCIPPQLSKFKYIRLAWTERVINLPTNYTACQSAIRKIIAT